MHESNKLCMKEKITRSVKKNKSDLSTLQEINQP